MGADVQSDSAEPPRYNSPMPPSCDLIALKPADLALLNAWAESDLPDGLTTHERLSRLKRLAQDQRVLGFKRHGQLMAAAVVDWASDPVHLETLIVGRAFRRQALGQALLTALLAKSQVLGASGLKLMVRLSAHSVLAFYAHCHAVRRDVHLGYYDDDDGVELFIPHPIPPR
jgi:ribosomal protein S18 acetylase RimI-like enzyme